jgi:hypothetical protein
MKPEQQRKKFEEWATSNESIGLDLDIDKNTNHYCDISTYAAWEAWQAARETIATVEETNHREFEEWLATIKYDNSNILSPSNLAWEAWQAAREQVTDQRDRLAEALDVCLREMLDVIYACNEEIVDANDTFHQAIKLGQKTLAAVEGGSDGLQG